MLDPKALDAAFGRLTATLVATLAKGGVIATTSGSSGTGRLCPAAALPPEQRDAAVERAHRNRLVAIDRRQVIEGRL